MFIENIPTMKRTFTVIVLFLSISIQAQAQKEVLFKIKVAPNRQYSMLMNMTMNMEMNLSGDTAIVSQAKKSGQSFPMVMTMSSGTTGLIKTGALNNSNKIPFSMILSTHPTKMVMNGQTTDVPVPVTNETLLGTYTPEGVMSIDSVVGKKADNVLKATMTKMMEGIQANIKFPEKPLKIGDTFTQEMPMDIPVAGFNAKMSSKITYKLVTIQDNKAYFDLKYDLSSDMSGQSMSIKMVGDGDGKFVYDILSSYGVDMVTNMNIAYSMNIPQAPTAKMDGKMKMLMDIKTTIGNN
jgi:hypothetical protein